MIVINFKITKNIKQPVSNYIAINNIRPTINFEKVKTKRQKKRTNTLRTKITDFLICNIKNVILICT